VETIILQYYYISPTLTTSGSVLLVLVTEAAKFRRERFVVT
jgi:hypothetical protein